MVVVVVVAVLANLQPLTHYQDAQRPAAARRRRRWHALEAQKAELQGQLAKLSETGYLETLAREQLTYVRPGEELYIVTKSAAGDDRIERRPAGRYRAGRRPSATADGDRTPLEPPGFWRDCFSAIRRAVLDAHGFGVRQSRAAGIPGRRRRTTRRPAARTTASKAGARGRSP